MEATKLLLVLLWSVVVKICLTPFRLVIFIIDICTTTLRIIRNTLAFLMEELSWELLKQEHHGKQERKTNEK